MKIQKYESIVKVIQQIKSYDSLVSPKGVTWEIMKAVNIEWAVTFLARLNSNQLWQTL